MRSAECNSAILQIANLRYGQSLTWINAAPSWPCQYCNVKTTADSAVPDCSASIHPAPPRVAFLSKRLMREWNTIVAMIQIYCAGQHGPILCADCQGLLEYAGLRLERCRFGVEKPTCANCPVHPRSPRGTNASPVRRAARSVTSARMAPRTIAGARSVV